MKSASTRFYISGSMTGSADYKKKFREAQEYLQGKGYRVCNPAVMELVLPDASYMEYINFDFMLLDKCDAIYLLKGWENSKGACMEYSYALAKDKLIFQEGEI